MINWPTSQEVLASGSLTLRPWELSDVDFVYTACQDPLIQEFTTVPSPYTLEDAKKFINRKREEFFSQVSMAYLGLVDNAPALSVSLHDIKVFDHLAELGYWVAKDFRGNGLGVKAAQLLTDYAFKIGFRRIEALTLPENIGSKRTLELSGFNFEVEIQNRLARRSGDQANGLLFSKFSDSLAN